MPVVDFELPAPRRGRHRFRRAALPPRPPDVGRPPSGVREARLASRSPLRVLVRLADGRELRLREFGTRQRAWAKLLRAGDVDGEEMVATLGPRPGRRRRWRSSRGGSTTPSPAPDAARPARDRRHRPLLGGRDPLEARLSPFKQGRKLDGEEVERLDAASHVLGDAIDRYEDVIEEQVPDKLPMPLQVHQRQGEPCPRCGATLAAVHFAEHVTTYCPRSSRRPGAQGPAPLAAAEVGRSRKASAPRAPDALRPGPRSAGG